MRVLIDTNVLLDFYAKREEFYNDARELLGALIDKNCRIYVAAYSIPTIGYILRKHFSLDEVKAITDDILAICRVIPLNRLGIINANNSNIKDYEDAFIEASAISQSVDYIVTRNIKDFSKSKVKAILPKNLKEILR